MKQNITCSDINCEFYGGPGCLGSADPFCLGTCLRGDGTCIIKGSAGIGVLGSISKKEFEMDYEPNIRD